MTFIELLSYVVCLQWFVSSDCYECKRAPLFSQPKRNLSLLCVTENSRLLNYPHTTRSFAVRGILDNFGGIIAKYHYRSRY